MKKNVYYFFGLIFVMNSLLFSEDLTGFWEVKFGDSKEQVTSVMTTRGWKLRENKDENLIFTKNKGYYENLPCDFINYSFYKEQFYEVTVSFNSNENVSLQQVQSLMMSIVRKYECFSIDTINLYDTLIQNLYITINENEIDFTDVFGVDNAWLSTSFRFTNLKLCNEKYN